MDHRARLLAAVTLPPLVTAAVGLTHPPTLTVETAHHWQMMHTILLPVFPLLALGPWLVARRSSRTAGVVVGVLAFVYACFYTSLDVIAGIAAGAVKHDGGVGLGTLFRVAGDLGDVGSYAYFAASAVALAVAARDLGVARVAPGAALVAVGAVMFWQEHVYRPWGVLAMVLLAAGWGWLALSARTPERAATPGS